MSFFRKHPPINILSNFELKLQYFYSDLLKTIKKTEKMKKAVLKSLGQSKQTHLQKANSKTSAQNAFFIFRYGPCHTSAVANHLLRMIEQNPFIFRDVLWKRCVNICCFGSSSVFEIVAFCKIFGLAQDLFWESTRKRLQINVTIVGEKMKKTVNQLLQVLLESTDIFDSSKMAICIQYVKANPAKFLSSSLVEVLKVADMVTMVKFVSAIRIKAVLEQFIWEVAENMKMESVLFFLDTGLTQQCQMFQKFLEPVNNFQSIYGPNDVEPFVLNIKSIQKCIELFWSKFGNICLTSCIVNSWTWLKTDPITEQNKAENEINRKTSRISKQMKAKKTLQEWCEKALKSQKVLKDYHQEVQRVIHKKSNKKEQQHEDDGCNLTCVRSKYAENLFVDLFKNKSKNKRIYLDK